MNKHNVIERHSHWCEVIEDELGHLFEWQSPLVIFTDRPHRAAAHYHLRTRTARNACEYNTIYAVLVGEAYDETIAHEVCHAAAKQMSPSSSWHGELFLWLMRGVCGFAGHTGRHDYPVDVQKKLAQLKRLKERISACEK